MNDPNDDWPDYQLLDFGGGRKLERFGSLTVDRPCPAAENEKPASKKWQADARYTGARVGDGKWKVAGELRSSWGEIEVPAPEACRFTLTIELSPAGQVGVFPEQLANWRWIARQVSRAGRPLRVLNLFAYSGGSTLAAAAAGGDVEVTHVDASKPSVALARQNAAASGLADAKIRWIVEDAVKYCRREVKRGSRYDAVIFDPPSYGHGPKGEQWRLARDLPALMDLVGELTARQPVFLLATCHTPVVGPAELSAYLSDGVFGSCSAPPTGSRLWLRASDGRKLESGVSVRWPT